MTDGQMAYWLDHTGDRLLGPGPVDNPTGWGKFDDLTHRIMRPQPGQLIQAISWCGRRRPDSVGRGQLVARERKEEGPHPPERVGPSSGQR